MTYPASNPPAPSPNTRESWIVAALLAGFFLLNLATATRSPTVWSDEVMYADPAVNWHSGHGFTSSAWFAQPSDEFWAGNVPLHAVALRGWLDVFGFSIVTVRAINYAWTALVAMLLWDFARRTTLVAQPSLRFLLVVLVWCGSGMCFSYRSGRPDMIGAAIVMGLVWLASGPHTRWRAVGIFFLAALLPWAGLQLVPFAVMLGTIVWAVHRSEVKTLLTLATGLLGGGIGLGALYLSHGVLPGFELSIARFAGANSAANKLAELATIYLRDPSGAVLLLALVALRLYHWHGRLAGHARSLDTGILVGLLVPLALHLSGKFAPYYTWMTFIPMGFCLGVSMDTRRDRPALKWLATGAMVVAAMIGLPLRLAVSALTWQERDYARVSNFVGTNLQPDDRVYCAYQAYYPAKQTAHAVYLPEYLRLMNAEERRATTVLVVPPADFASTSEQFGGSWTPGPVFSTSASANPFLSGQKLAAPYELQIFRRSTNRAKP